MSNDRVKVLGTDTAVVAFVANALHKLAPSLEGIVVQFAQPDDDEPEADDDDFSAENIIVVVGRTASQITTMKKALQHSGYPGIILVIIYNSCIPIKKSGDLDGEWDKRNFHYGDQTTPNDLTAWFSRRLQDVKNYYDMLVCCAG